MLQSSCTPKIEQCFEVIEAVMRYEPKREYPVFNKISSNFLAASDAAVQASIQVQEVFTSSFSKLTVPKPVSVLWPTSALSFVPFGSLRNPTLSNCHGLWFLDTVAADMTL